MSLLNDEQTALIAGLISAGGVEQESLFIDLNDHLCTDVEDAMAKGAAFETALLNAYTKFGVSGLRTVQSETYSIVTPNLLVMKTITFIVGALSALFLFFGMFFKIMHWPFASLLIVLGAGNMISLFLPLLLVHNLRGASTWGERIFHITGYFGVAVLATGVLFKIMHWPMATPIVNAGSALLLFVYLPLYFYRRYQKSVNKAVTAAAFLVSFTSILLVLALLPKDNANEMAPFHFQTVDSGLLAAGKALSAMHVQTDPTRDVVDAADHMIAALLANDGSVVDASGWTNTTTLNHPGNRSSVRFVVYEQHGYVAALSTAMKTVQAQEPLQAFSTSSRPFALYPLSGHPDGDHEQMRGMFAQMTMAEAVQTLNSIKVEALHQSALALHQRLERSELAE